MPHCSTAHSRRLLMRRRRPSLRRSHGLRQHCRRDVPRAQRPARQLPNCAHWRDSVWPYMNAICNVRRVYVDHADRKRDYTIPRGVDELHVNPNTPPRWMQELKNLLLDIF